MSACILGTTRRAPLRLSARTLTRTPAPAPARTYANTTVDLAYDLTLPPKPRPEADGQSLLIAHGLFGSKQNWRSLAKGFAQKLGMPVYTVDLRNHGASPHATPHTYAAMADDLAAFMAKHDLQRVNLMGHSMGGKASMVVALTEGLNKPLRSLISVDMSAAATKLSPDFVSYIDGMLEIQDARVPSRAAADALLQKYEPSLSIRQFLLTNAVASDGVVDFRIPLRLLKLQVDNLGRFPYTPPPPVSATSPQWAGPALFIKGGESKYLNKYNIPVCQAYFPNMRLETLEGAGHWVHAEKPKEVVELVYEFVNSVDEK
ncbi:hypothetical protein VHUM_03094 [Vanrija humicola]|uniref:AB hydrolase-1 domain-containing protein n=1 Tax=Vanrija humicola TaxID=5417 RepID=A0A7D8UYK8_VANHU|nr:hypothetical protein VHUM_03094 [Vanrija humicola]